MHVLCVKVLIHIEYSEKTSSGKVGECVILDFVHPGCKIFCQEVKIKPNGDKPVLSAPNIIFALTPILSS